MSIVAADILYKYSTKAGAAGNANGSTPANSLGKYISTTDWDQNTLMNNLFSDLSGVDNEADEEHYRCLFVRNNHGSLTAQGVLIYLPVAEDQSGGAEVYMGADPTAAKAIGSSAAQAVEIATEGDAPAGVTFPGFVSGNKPVDVATAISLGDILPGYCKAIWILRKGNHSVAQANDGFGLQVTLGSL